MFKALVGAALVLSLLGAACGGEADDGGVASLSEDKQAEGEEGSSEDLDPQEAALAWAECMRENGVDVPDPKVDDNGMFIIEGGEISEGSSEDFEGADEECRDLLGDPPGAQLSDEEKAELNDAGLRFAKCMREEGIDVPDPGPHGQSITIGGPDGVDPEDPTFVAAEEKCRHIMEEVMGPATGEGVTEVGADS